LLKAIPFVSQPQKFFQFFFSGLSFLRFCFWFSAFLGALTIFSVYSIGRTLFNPLVGLFSAFFFNLSPYVLIRTMAGVLDTDGINLLLLSSIVALFALALSKITKENSDKKTAWLFSFLAGVLMAIWAWTWVGYWLSFWLLFALLILHFFIRVLNQILNQKEGPSKEKVKKICFSFKPYFVLYSILFLTFFLIASFLTSPDIVKTTVLSPFQFFSTKTSLAESTIEGFPSFMPFVDELQSPFNWSPFIIIKDLGTVNFILGALGFFLLFFFFIKNFKISHWQYLFPLLLTWFLVTLFPFLTAVRFGEYFVLPLAILAGFLLIVIWQKTFEFLKRGGLLSKPILVFLVILTFLSFLLPYNEARKFALFSKTPVNENWTEALSWLRGKTQKNAVVVNWWDSGYWILALAERRVIIDGGAFDSKKETPLTEISTSDCRERGGYIKDSSCITSRIQDISNVFFTSNEKKALNILKDYQDKAPEIYLLLSRDLISKSSYWSYFATWDREKKEGKKYKYKIEPGTQRSLVWAPEELKESLFTKLFLAEEKSPFFELKYKNPEIKIYKVKI